jgi:hypothetical protein
MWSEAAGGGGLAFGTPGGGCAGGMGQSGGARGKACLCRAQAGIRGV